MSRAEMDRFVEQIRESVYAAGLDASVPEFGETRKIEKWNDIYLTALHQEIASLHQNYFVDAGVRSSSSRLKTKIKCIIGKIAGLYVRPIVAEQNLYNINVLQAIERLSEIITQQEQEIAELKRDLVAAEEGKDE